jgi:hypothetical protein
MGIKTNAIIAFLTNLFGGIFIILGFFTIINLFLRSDFILIIIGVVLIIVGIISVIYSKRIKFGIYNKFIKKIILERSLFVWGILFLSLLVSDLIDTIYIYQNMNISSPTITKQIITPKNDENDEEYYTEFYFKNDENKIIYSHTRNYPVNDTIEWKKATVFYNKKNPDFNVLRNDKQNIFHNGLMLVISLFISTLLYQIIRFSFEIYNEIWKKKSSLIN